MMDSLEEAVLAGETRAIAKAISIAEAGGKPAAELIARLRPLARGGHLIGLTGAPGAGKSTLMSALAKQFRALGRSVGVIAVDPSSPFSGGAVLGDRIRMQELVSDAGVFVRSMASACRPGGLASAVEDAAVILRAAGKDVVLVETVGVGQGEMDVANVVQTVVVVLTPGMGDEIQSLKAGILEVADLYVVNKADLPGAEAVVRSVLSVAAQAPGDWMKPVVKTSAQTGEGISDLAEAIDSHREYLRDHRCAGEAETRLACRRILSLAGQQLLDELESIIDPKRLELLAANVVAGTLEPREAAQEAVRLLFAAQRKSSAPAGRGTYAGRTVQDGSDNRVLNIR